MDEIHHNNLDNKNIFCRYSDIITYKYNRVQINSNNGFINASWIHMPSMRHFIATQGPLQSTIDDFWEMCFLYDVKIIVILCNLIENNREKCANYWDNYIKNYKLIKLNNDMEIDNGLMIKEFQIVNKVNSISKKIIQVHLKCWNDHAAPISNYYKIIKIINLIDKYKQNSPVVVHCSAGVGRTGTFIGLYNLYNEIIGQINNILLREIKFSIFNLVRKLKEMRLYLVENEDQYILLYQFASILLNEKNI